MKTKYIILTLLLLLAISTSTYSQLVMPQPQGGVICPGSSHTFDTWFGGVLQIGWERKADLSDPEWTIVVPLGTASRYRSYTTSVPGYYRARLQNPNLGQDVYSNVVQLTLKPVPTITTHPTGGIYGTVTQLTVTATANGTVTYQWYKDGTELPGQTSATCPISGVGSYYATAVNDNNGCPVSSNTVEITKKPLTITGFTIQNKPYDGTTTATIGNAGTLQGVVGTDNVQINTAGASLTFADANVGNNKAVNISGITLGGTHAGNYTLQQQPAGITANITKAPLTVTARPQNMVYGTDPTTLNLTGAYDISGFVNNENEAVLTIQPTVNIDASITSVTPAGTHNNKVLVSGTAAGNYAITHTPNALTITQSQVGGNITFDPVAAKTYGNAPFNLTGRHDLGKSLTYESSDAGIVSIEQVGNDWKATIHEAGNVTLMAKFAGDSDVSAESVPQAITIAKATLEVTARNITRQFNQANPDVSTAYDYGTFVNDADKNKFTTEPMASISHTDYPQNKAVGIYPGAVIVSGGVHPNYNFTYQSGTLTIEHATGDINLTAVGNKVYGDNEFTLTANHVGGNTVKFESSDNTILSITENADVWTAKILKAGTATIKAYTVQGNNYAAAEKSETIAINPALLTIRPNDAVRKYGQANPAFSFEISGLKYADTKADLGTVTIITTADAGSPVADYDITASGAVNSNYNIQYNTGKLTVEKAVLTLTLINNQTATYTGSDLEVSPATLSGVIGGASIPVSYSYNKGGDITTKAKEAGTYTVTASVAGDANHAGASAVTTVTVAKATPVITLTSVTTSFTGNPVPVNTPVVTGSTTAASLPLVIRYKGVNETAYPETTQAPTDYGQYEVTVNTAGNANHNAAGATTTVSIGQAAPAMSLTGDSKTYDGTPLALTASITPNTLPVTYSYQGTLKDGTAYPATDQAPTDAGNYTATASTPGDMNYSPASVQASIEITKRNAVIIMNNKSTPFTGNPITIDAPLTEPAGATLTITYKGIGNTTYTEKPTPPTNGGTYEVKAVFAGNNNYKPASATANLTITDAGAPTLTLDNKTVIYNGQQQAIGTAFIQPHAAHYLTVTYTYSNAGYPALTIPPVNAGVYMVTATTPADANFSAGMVTATFTIEKALQTITFDLPDMKQLSDPGFNIDAQASSGLPLTYQSGNTGIATINSDGLITLHSPGIVTITVSQAGNENFLPASKTHTLYVSDGEYVIMTVDLDLAQSALLDHIGLNPVESTIHVLKGKLFEMRLWLNDYVHQSNVVVELNGQPLTPASVESRSTTTNENLLRTDSQWERFYIYRMTVTENSTLKIKGITWNDGKGSTTGSLSNPSREAVSIYTIPGHIVLQQNNEKEKEGAAIRIYSIAGHLVYFSQEWGTTLSIPVDKGVYIVVTGDKRQKVVVR